MGFQQVDDDGSKGINFGQGHEFAVLFTVLQFMEPVPDHVVEAAALLMHAGRLPRAFIRQGDDVGKVHGMDVSLDGSTGLADFPGFSHVVDAAGPLDSIGGARFRPLVDQLETLG